MADFDDTQGRIGDTSGRIGDTSGRIGDTSGKTMEDVRLDIVRGRADERLNCLQDKVARLEQDILYVASYLDSRMRALEERLASKAGEAQLLTLERQLLAAIKTQIAAALAPLEARLRKLETPPS